MKQQVKSSLRDALTGLMGSKKSIVLISSLFCWALGVFGLHLNPTDLAVPMGTVAAWLVGQGTADRGKEAEKEKNKRGHEDYDDAKEG